MIIDCSTCGEIESSVGSGEFGEYPVCPKCGEPAERAVVFGSVFEHPITGRNFFCFGAMQEGIHGDFIKSLAHTICVADDVNADRIGQVFPKIGYAYKWGMKHGFHVQSPGAAGWIGRMSDPHTEAGDLVWGEFDPETGKKL